MEKEIMLLPTFSLRYSRLNLPYTRNSKSAPNAILGFTRSATPKPGPANEAYRLTNFDRLLMVMDGVEFTSSEQAYVWLKNPDPIFRRAVMAARSPGEAKRLGRQVALPPEWDTKGCFEAMFKVLMAKFELPSYKKYLISTGYAYLCEVNYHGDVKWGTNASTTRGENHLGRILMCVREIKRLIG